MGDAFRVEWRWGWRVGLIVGMALLGAGACQMGRREAARSGEWGGVIAGEAPTMAAVGAVHSHPGEVRLWEGGAPGSEKFAGVAEVVEWRTEKDSITGESFSFPTVTNIHVPTITPYLPKGVRKGGMPAVIIAPGGGHQFLTINHEGYDVAEFLARHGVAAFVLKYRLARARSYPAGTYAIEREALADGQRAIRLVRARAGEWGIDPEKIGMMGFSAGGEVAVQVNLHPTEGRTDGDRVDRESCRMNFQGLIYPGVSRLIQPVKEGAGGGGGWPPVFLACSFDDRTDIAGAVEGAGAATRPAGAGLADVYLRYKAAGVPAELHIYSEGGHGFGMRQRGIEESGWGGAFVAWMRDRGYVGR